VVTGDANKEEILALQKTEVLDSFEALNRMLSVGSAADTEARVQR